MAVYIVSITSSCDEADIDNWTFHFSPDDAEDVDNVDAHKDTVASFVAQSKHTLTIDDIRLFDPRFPNGSPCLQVSIANRTSVDWNWSD